MRIHWIWLAELPELTLRQKLQLLEHISDAEDLFCAEADDLPESVRHAFENRDLTLADKIMRKCAQKKITVLTYGDAAYPDRLRSISDPPLVLYIRGVVPDWAAQPVIGVVGTRKATPYGLNTAKKLSAEIALCGGLVVSGGAAGVDAAAMSGALSAGKPVVGVLGCGVDVVYPTVNRKLFSDTVEQGCLISEYPPGARPERWHFPQRNRIISGLANGILVTEAPEKSGALITARRGMEQGRDVFAVPGNIDVPTCVGSNGLLRDGAAPVLTGWDIMEGYAPMYPKTVHRYTGAALEQEPEAPSPQSDKKDIDNMFQTTYSGIEIQKTDLSEEEQQVLSALTAQPRPVDEVIAQVALPANRVLSLLTMLALKGVVMNHPGRLVSVNIPKG